MNIKSVLYYAVIFLMAFIKLSSGGFFDYLHEKTLCQFTECCNNDYIPADIESLTEKLKKNLFGQHIVEQELVAALSAHYKSTQKSRKPLVLSFHGTPGTGKSMVANMIIESIYLYGLKSKYVHIFNGRVAFPMEANIDLYNKRISDTVLESLQNCPRSIFIFNEVNKMPAGIFESLASIVDYRLEKVDNSQAVFIFISNTAGIQISDHLGNLMKGSLMRISTQLSDFEEIIRIASFNLDGGLKKTGLIGTHVIDHFIPFLPLEVEHVRQCLKKEYNSWYNHNYDSLKEKIEKIIKNSVSFDSTHGLFAAFGCKGLDKDVALDIKRTRQITNEL